MRLLNFCLVIVLVLATAYVYEIKFEATLRATKVAEMRGEVRRERDAIAAQRAEWARLKSPSRLEALAKRHLNIRPAEISQLDSLNHLPARPMEIVAPAPAELMATTPRNPDPEIPTGSILADPEAR